MVRRQQHHQVFGGGGPPPSPASKDIPNKDALLALIALQLFDGSWDPEAPQLFRLILAAALPDAAQADAAPADGAEKIFREFCREDGARKATALAIVAMRIGQSERKEEWAMIEEKAVDWLEEEDSSEAATTTTTVEELLRAAEKVLKSASVKT